jgi:hypothetical protein
MMRRVIDWLEGVVVNDSLISIRKQVHWIRIQRDQIRVVKFRRGDVIIRLADGRRIRLSLFGLGNRAYDRAVSALKSSLHKLPTRTGGKSAYTLLINAELLREDYPG